MYIQVILIERLKFRPMSTTPYDLPYESTLKLPYATTKHINARCEVEDFGKILSHDKKNNIIDVAADGKCLYRCIAACRYGHENGFQQVRTEIAAYCKDTLPELELPTSFWNDEFKKSIEQAVQKQGRARPSDNSVQIALDHMLGEDKVLTLGDKKALCNFYANVIQNTQLWGGDMEVSLAAMTYNVVIHQYYWPYDVKLSTNPHQPVYVARYQFDDCDKTPDTDKPQWFFVLKYKDGSKNFENGHYQYVNPLLAHTTVQVLRNRSDGDTASTSTASTSPDVVVEPFVTLYNSTNTNHMTAAERREWINAQRKKRGRAVEKGVNDLAQLREMQRERWKEHTRQSGHATPTPSPEQMSPPPAPVQPPPSAPPPDQPASSCDHCCPSYDVTLTPEEVLQLIALTEQPSQPSSDDGMQDATQKLTNVPGIDRQGAEKMLRNPDLADFLKNIGVV